MHKKLSDGMTVNVNVSNQTMVRAVAIAVTFVLLIAAIYVARHPLTLVIIAFFLALALSPAVNWLAQKLPGRSDLRGVATALAYIVILSILSLLLYLLVPPLARQTQVFIDELPTFISEIETGGDFISEIVQRYELTEQINDFQNTLTDRLTSDISGPLVDFLSKLFSNVASVIIVIVLAFFMLVEGPAWLERYWKLLAPRRREHHKEMAQKMYKVITGFVSGQLLVAALAATSTYVALSIVGIGFALPLAVLVGIFGLIPFIGATIASIIVVIAALFESAAAAIIMLVFYVVYQQIENNFIQPIIQSRTIEMSPMLVFIASVIGLYVGGILGAVVAIPVAGCVRVLANDYIDRKHLIHATK